MRRMTTIINGLFALMVCVVLFGQTTRVGLPETIDKKNAPLTLSQSEVAKSKVLQKPDSIEILKGNRDSLSRQNINSLIVTEKKIDQIPRLVERLILKEQRLNTMRIERIVFPAYVWPDPPFPEYKPDTTTKKKSKGYDFLGFSTNE